jgi:hypothetical protein
MFKILIGFFLSVNIFSGCTKSARLYTSSGQILTMNFSYDGTGKGTVWGTFPNGEVFKGEYFTVANEGINVSNFSTPWGPLTGISVSQSGPQISHVTAVGSRGTQIQCTSFPRGAHGFGKCRDSKGHQYRLHY